MNLIKIKDPQNAADNIYNIAQEVCDFYTDQNGDSFLVSYNGNNYDLKYLSNSDSTKQFLRLLYFESYRHTVKNASVQTAYDTIVANVEEHADLMPVYTRIGRHKNTIYYDLCNKNGEVIAIDNARYKKISSDKVSGMFFRRDAMMRNQVEPVQNKKYSLLDFINDFFNVEDELKLLLAVYICVAFVPLIDHPILIVEGEKGSGKSTFLRHLGEIINPTKKNVLSLPTNKSDLITAISNNYFAPFDNIGKISNEYADVFCQAATGGTMSKRKLFSDNTEFPIDFKRLVALNGINMGIVQSDLLDRSIFIRLERFKESEYKPLQFIQKNFNKYLPYALNNIFSILSKALKILPTINLKHYDRMGDFIHYGYAIAEAIQKGYGQKFYNDYKSNRRLSTKAVIEQNPLLESLELFAENHSYWYGTATDLLKQLQQCLRAKYGVTNSNLSQKKPNIVSRELKNYSYELKEIGIEVEIGRSKERFIKISKIGSKTPSTASIPTTKNDLNAKNRKTLLDDED